MINATMSASKMEIDREREDEILQLQGDSVEDALSCSSSILNTDNDGAEDADDYDDDDDFEDGINVTLLSSPPPIIVPNTSDGQKNTPSQDNGRTTRKLSGAGQKRLKKLLDRGISYEEAYRLAEKPPQSSDPSKRPRQMDLNGSNTSGNPTPAKIARRNKGSRTQAKTSSVQHRIDTAQTGHSAPTRNSEGKVKPSYRDVANYVKLGILSTGYPETELTTEQLKTTQKAILAKVVGQRKEQLKPKFGDCVFKSGYLVIVCKNKETADWLKSIVSTITPWPGAELTAVDEKNIPQPEILIGFFPWSTEDKNEEILALLESQNDGLAVDAWRILQRNTISQRHVELVFTVDGASLNSIKQCEFSLDYKFGNATLRKKFRRKNQQEGSERPKHRDENDSHMTREGTGDDKMIVDQSVQIPGPSGIERTKTNHNASGHTTSTDVHKQSEPRTSNKRIKSMYRDIKVQVDKHPIKGGRETKDREILNPHASGKQKKDLQ